MLDWTLAPAVAACDVVIVTSDAQAILDHVLGWARARDAEIILRRRLPMLATSRTPDLPVIRDAYGYIPQEPEDILVLLRPTAPFRRAEEIRAVAALLRQFPFVDSVRSVVPAHEHPEKMYREVGDWVVPAGQGDVRYPRLEPATGRHRANHPRQWLDPAYRACGFVDAVRAEVLVGLDSLEGDLILGWPAPPERAVELDDEADWAAAEALAVERGWQPGVG